MTTTTNQEVVIDGTNLIFGRMASQIAKKLLCGEAISIVNCEKIVIKGDPKQIAQRYLTKKGIKHKGTPERSPAWSRVPHILIKRMLRGMLPRKRLRGKDAIRRLKVYTGNPNKLNQNISLEQEATFKGFGRHITINELCKKMGYTS